MSTTIYSANYHPSSISLLHDSNGNYHLIYMIVNKINNKIYIGKHSTKNPYDDYMGSGRAINAAINKYGLENFEKTILYCFDSEDKAYLKESEIVDENFVKRQDTYNMKCGGKGNSSCDIKGKFKGENNPRYGCVLSNQQKDKIRNTLQSTYNEHPEIKKQISDTLKEYYKNNPEVKEKISKRNKGRASARRINVYMVSCEAENYGEIITTFSSFTEAAYKTNTHVSTISFIVNKLNGQEYYRRIFNDNKPSVRVGWTLVKEDDYNMIFEKNTKIKVE